MKYVSKALQAETNRKANESPFRSHCKTFYITHHSDSKLFLSSIIDCFPHRAHFRFNFGFAQKLLP